MQNLHLKCGYKYSYLLTYLVEYSIRYWTEYSSSKKLDSHTPTHKSTFGVHYRTGSPGQLGLRVAEFPGDWVTKCDPVPCLVAIPDYLRRDRIGRRGGVAVYVRTSLKAKIWQYSGDNHVFELLWITFGDLFVSRGRLRACSHGSRFADNLAFRRGLRSLTLTTLHLGHSYYCRR